MLGQRTSQVAFHRWFPKSSSKKLIGTTVGDNDDSVVAFTTNTTPGYYITNGGRGGGRYSNSTANSRRYFATTTTTTLSSLRRSRKRFEKYSNPQMGTIVPTTTSTPSGSGLEEPFQYSGDSIEEYSQKATLSPWVPVPDSVARKIFDRADVQSDDVSKKEEREE